MRKLYHSLCKFEEIACGVGFIFLVIFVFLAAILRFFRVSMSWNIDLAMLLLAWTAFLGADIAWRAGQLVGIDLITRQLPRAVQKVLTIVIYILITAAMLVILIFGVKLAWIERVRTYQSMPIPYSLVTLSLVIAGTSMVISTILKIKRCIITWNKE